MLRQRFVAAFLGLPMLVVLLWLNWFTRQHGNNDDLFLLLIVQIISGASGWEAGRIVRHRFPGATPWNGAYAALILPFIIHAVRPTFGGDAPIGSLGLLIDSLGATTAVMLLFLGVWADVENRGREGLKENLWILSAGLYLGLTTSFLLLLGNTAFREIAVALVFVAVFSLDTAAFFGGKRFGGPHLAPKISPNKTWSGAAFGLLGAVAASFVFYFLPGLPGEARIGAAIPWWGFLILGAGIGALGQLGDLLESAFKRWGNVKDSGTALPGHGGFLDRFDSLFLAAPIGYLLLRLLMLV